MEQDQAIKVFESLASGLRLDVYRLLMRAGPEGLVAGDIAAELLRFARFENVTQIVVGRSRGGFLSELLRRSLPHELVRRAAGISIHVLTDDGRGSPGRRPDLAAPAVHPVDLAWAAAGVAAAAASGLPI